MLAVRAAAALERGRARRARDLADIGLNAHPVGHEAQSLLLLRGRAELCLGLVAEARLSAQRAIGLSPNDSAGAHGLLADVAARLGRHEDAAASYERATAIEPARAAWYAGWATALLDLEQPEGAAAAAQRTLTLDPGNADALLVLGRIALREGRPEQSVHFLAAALARAPERADVHTTLGIALAAQGDIAAGLREYEWRQRLIGWNLRRLDIPAWGGEPLSGKRLLVWSEQGLGDNLQFVRFASQAKRRGAKVLFHGDPRLVRLFQACPGLDQVHSLQDSRPPADVHASLLSLPALLGVSNEGLATELPYLRAERSRTQTWWARWRTSGRARPRVALVWQGNPGFCDDGQRSFALAQLLPLVRELAGCVDFVSLQKGFGQDQLHGLAADTPIVDLGTELDTHGHAFVDSAAVLETVDLLLTSDTALAHLAGALARPVWLLLSRVPDWRWGVSGETTPWYPTMRLFRQQRCGDWPRVMEELGCALRAWVAELR